MQNKHLSKTSRRTFLKLGGAVMGSGFATSCGALSLLPTPKPTSTPLPAPEPEQDATGTALPSTQYRGMWFSYLEWQGADFSSAEAFTSYIAHAFDQCTAMGINTIIAQVRPFGDAFYQSNLYPWSHFITGTQGQAPSFDPFALMVSLAHERALSIEAWINPYRLRLNATMPEHLCDTNLATLHPEWVVEVGEGLYLNPAIPEAADYVCAGVAEILEGYPVDGIHFDDYFYPTTEAFIDEAQFIASGETDRDAWRRENVTKLVHKAYQTVKAVDPTLRFGISPQGNPENNQTQQFSDVSAWMNPAPGEACVDYICPQLYWGYHYTLQSGSDRFAFENILPEWLAMPRAEGVALYFGLGAFRIGDGDGGQNADSETQWNTGENLASMIADITSLQGDGYVLYRYNSLFGSAYESVAAFEVANITAMNGANE